MKKKYSCNQCKNDPSFEKLKSGILCKSTIPPQEIDGMCNQFKKVAESSIIGDYCGYSFVE